MKYVVGWRLPVACIACLMLLSPLSAQTVVNGDFEADNFTLWPGYVGGENPAELSGWVGTGGRGINPIADGSAPFRDNGNNDTQVAFLQGESYIEQTVTGITPNTDYTLSFDFNSRNCCGGALPYAEVTLNGIPAGNSIALFGDPGAIPSVGDNDWHHADIEFNSLAFEDITIRFATRPAESGDSTFLLDNVSLVPEPSSGLMLLLGLAGFAARRRHR